MCVACVICHTLFDPCFSEFSCFVWSKSERVEWRTPDLFLFHRRSFVIAPGKTSRVSKWGWNERSVGMIAAKVHLAFFILPYLCLFRRSERVLGIERESLSVFRFCFLIAHSAKLFLTRSIAFPTSVETREWLGVLQPKSAAFPRCSCTLSLWIDVVREHGDWRDFSSDCESPFRILSDVFW